MTRRSEPLDHEERALAELLARDATPGPSPQLDARILAAARAATPGAAPRRPRPRWIAGMGIAATLVLAVGIAWRARPLPERPAARATPVAAVRMVEPRADSAAATARAAVYAPMPPPPERIAGPVADAPAPKADARERAPAEPPVAFDEPSPLDAQAADAFIASPPSPAPPPPPPPPAPGITASPAPTAKASADAAQPSHAQEQARTLDRVQITGSRIPAANAAEAADAAASDEALPPRAELDVEPPATADSPLVQDAWLQRIRELLASGDAESARGSLAEFRRRYPKYPLPDDLRALARP